VQVPALTYGVVMVQTVQGTGTSFNIQCGYGTDCTGAGTSFNIQCGYGTDCTGCRYQL